MAPRKLLLGAILSQFTCGFHWVEILLGRRMGAWIHQIAQCVITWCK